MAQLPAKTVWLGNPQSSTHNPSLPAVADWAEGVETLAASGGLSYFDGTYAALNARAGVTDGQFAQVVSEAAEGGIYERVGGEWVKVADYVNSQFTESAAADEAHEYRDQTLAYRNEAASSELAAEVAAGTASTQAGIATSAAQAAGAPIYPDTTAGLAGVAEGETFLVPGQSGMLIYLKTGGTADLRGRLGELWFDTVAEFLAYDGAAVPVGTYAATRDGVGRYLRVTDGTGHVPLGSPDWAVQVVDAAAFGAAADGVTNDAPFIQALIDAGFDAEIDLRGRSHVFSDTVNLANGTRIKNGTIVQGADNISCLYGDGISGFAVSEITFVGRSIAAAPNATTVGRYQPNQAIKLVNSCSDGVIRGNTISGFENHGIYAYGSVRLLIENNDISGIGARNTAVDTPINSSAFSAYSGGLSCLYIDGGLSDTNSQITIRRNRLGGCLNTILSLVYAVDGADVYENEFYDGDSNAFQWGTGCEAVKCRDNSVRDLTGLYDPTIEGYAFSIHQEGHHSEIVRNTIVNVKRGAINTKGSDYVVVADNYIRNGNENANFGAIVAYGSFLRISDNTLYDCSFNGIHVSTEDSVVRGNSIDFSSTTAHSAIVVNTTYNGAATRNEVIGNVSVQSGLLISVAAPNTVANDNSGFAFYVSDATSVTRLTNNRISEYRASGGGNYGLRVSGSGASAVVTGGSNTATNKYQSWAGGVVYISPTTNDFRRLYYGSAAPTSGTWAQGDVVYNQTPVAGGSIGWVCTSGGTPGTWKTFGSISA